MKKKNWSKKIASILTCVTIAAASVGMPALSTVAEAAETTQAPGVTAFADRNLLADKSVFSLYDASGKSTALAQKVNFGKGKTWYIAGEQNGQLVLMCDPETPLSLGQAFHADHSAIRDYEAAMGVYSNGAPLKVNANHYGASDIRNYLKTDALNFFTSAEKELMLEPKVYTKDLKNSGSVYSTSDKLYLAHGNYADESYIVIGSNSEADLNGGIKIGIDAKVSTAGSPYGDYNSDMFWLRTALGQDVLIAYPGYGEYSFTVNDKNPVVPAIHLDLSSVVFASAAEKAAAGAALTDTMTIRFNGKGKIFSKAKYYEDKVNVTKGGSNEYIYIQYNDGKEEVFSKAITEDMTISLSEAGVDNFKNCKIWIEKYYEKTNLTHAVMASEETAPTVDTSVTVNDLTVTAGIGEAELTWSPIPGAIKYAVYMKNAAGTTTALASGVTTTSYKATGLPEGEKVGFIVRPCFDSWGNYGTIVWTMIHSNETVVPAKVVVVPADNMATVSWSEVSGAAAYALYQKNADGTTTLLSNKITGTTYTVTGLADGARVGFIVRAKLGTTWYGYSAVNWTTLPAPAVPPTGVSAKAGDGCATVTWNEVPGALRYALYKKTTTGGLTLISAEVTGTSYEVTGLTNGENVGFVLKSRTSKGWSTWSATGWAKPQSGK